MKKLVSFLIYSVLAGSFFVSCRKADPVLPKTQSELSDIYASSFGNGKDRMFDARFSTNKDTIYFDIPWYYPVNSDNEVDLTKMIVRATIPTDAVLTPALGEVMDISHPFNLTVTAGDGTQSSYVVVAKKVGDLSVYKAVITFMNNGEAEQIEGVIQNNEVIFYVLPGTDVSNAMLTYQINTHSTGSIAQETTVDLSQNLPFTVTGVDGSTKTYTFRSAEPVKLDYGFGINRKLWSKAGSEFNFGANMETGLAISGDYLVLVRRTNPSKYSVYNRFTGQYVQDMYYPFGGLSFQMTEDSTGNLLASSWAPKNSHFILYKYSDPFDTNPVKLVDWVNSNPTGITLDGGVGRRVNIFGDLNHDAVIMATAGQSDVIYKWRVVNGALVSNDPEVIVYQTVAGGATSKMGYYAEAQPVSADANTDYFVNYQFEVALVSGITNSRTAALTLGWPVVFTMPTAYTTFNHAKYLAIVKFIDTYSLNKIQTSLFDVTQQSRISMDPASADYSSFNVFNSDAFSGTANGNGTADICIGYTDNKERMQVYTLLTNGGITAHEFTIYAP